MSAAQGDRIMVKGPGSNSYVRAKVLDVVKGDYKVAYDNGKEQIVAAKFIKVIVILYVFLIIIAQMDLILMSRIKIR